MEPFQRLKPAARRLFHRSEEAGNRSSVGACHEQTSKPAGTLACRQNGMAARQDSTRTACCSASALTYWLLVLLSCFSAIMPPCLHTRETASRLAGRRAFLPDNTLTFLLAYLPADMQTACLACLSYCRHAAGFSGQADGWPSCWLVYILVVLSACFRAGLPAEFPADVTTGCT